MTYIYEQQTGSTWNMAWHRNVAAMIIGGRILWILKQSKDSKDVS